MLSKLTPKQERFVEEYLFDLNGKQAAIRAGYSPKNAEHIGYQLLQKTPVRARVDEALAERSKRTGISAERVLRELARIAFVNPDDIVNLEYAQIVPNASREDTAAIAAVKIKQIPTPEGIGVEREIRFTDKNKALELLGKHLGMFADKVKFEGVVPVVITGDGKLED